MTPEQALGRIRQWTHEHGTALCPTGGYADTYGDGMRSAKKQVGDLLDRLDSQVKVSPQKVEEFTRRAKEALQLNNHTSVYYESDCSLVGVRWGDGKSVLVAETRNVAG